MKIDRLTGAEAISQKAIEIGAALGVVINRCVWDMGEDFTHEYAHRLDLFAETKTVRLYFSDLELTTSGNEARARRMEDRLQNAVAQLVTRAPSPTYSYR